MSHYTCNNCGQRYDQCACSNPHIVPDAVSNVTPIKPTVKPEAIHVDLRFDPGYTTDDLLAKASANDLKGALVLGYKADGSLYIDCNIQDGPLALWVLQVAMKRLMSEA